MTEQLPIEGLPIWARFSGVGLHDVKITESDGKGYGVVCQKKLITNPDTTDKQILLTVPHALVLNQDAVREHAKEDHAFKQLLDAVGHRVCSPLTPAAHLPRVELTNRQSARADILLFLLVQRALASKHQHKSAGILNPWTHYLRFLPINVSVPTLWNGDERLLLRGTSLDTAINAKMKALITEFDTIRATSSQIPCWNELLWNDVTISLRDWIQLEALYRSRCLELPRSGASMVPCIDMVNHSMNSTAYYDETDQDEVILVARPGVNLDEGQEVTISYGESKSAAEMLFSYGFIDPESTVDSLAIPLDNPFDDDPLAKAKRVGFGEVPMIRLERDDSGTIKWKCPFVHLMCLNEEDGLNFRILQDNEGGQQLRIFWQDDDVTDRAKDFESLVQTHPLQPLFRIRAVIVLHESLQTQLEQARLYGNVSEPGDVRPECLDAAQTLRTMETRLLEDGIEVLENEVCSVVTIMGSKSWIH